MNSRISGSQYHELCSLENLTPAVSLSTSGKEGENSPSSQKNRCDSIHSPIHLIVQFLAQTESLRSVGSPSLYSLFWIMAISTVLNILGSGAALAMPTQKDSKQTEALKYSSGERLTVAAQPIFQNSEPLETSPSINQLLNNFDQGVFQSNSNSINLESYIQNEQSKTNPELSQANHLGLPGRIFQSAEFLGEVNSQKTSAGAIAQNPDPINPQKDVPTMTPPSASIRRQGSEILGKPSIQLQGVYVLQGNESSARGRVNALYPVSPTALFGAVVDLTTGDAFSDSPGTGLRLNELYFAYAPFEQLPGLRFVVGLMDLTSYFDRNSFAKDGASQFFNQAFQTNPALSAAGLGSRPGLLMNWSITDNIEIKATGFSSHRNLGSFSLDSFAAEADFRTGNFILRGTFITSKDSGQNTGFEEIYSIPRSSGFGVLDGDRENAFGLNAEYFVPSLKLGFFGRYGWYKDITLGESGNTYSFGVVRLDLFTPNDRLGIAYGRQLSNNSLRRDRGDKIPDVLEVYYDIPITKFLRLGVTFQELNQFSETIIGFRIKTEFSVLGSLFK